MRKKKPFFKLLVRAQQGGRGWKGLGSALCVSGRLCLTPTCRYNPTASCFGAQPCSRGETQRGLQKQEGSTEKGAAPAACCRPLGARWPQIVPSCRCPLPPQLCPPEKGPTLGGIGGRIRPC